MASNASQLKESLLTKSRSSRRSRWDEDEDLACSALDINEGACDSELESRDLLLKVAGSKSQIKPNYFPCAENNCANLALSTAPISHSVVSGTAQTAFQSVLLESCPNSFHSRPIYATHGAKSSQMSSLHKSSKPMTRSHALLMRGTTINLPATPLICSLQTAETNKNLSATMQTVSSTLEQQYVALLQEAASKIGEAAALYYLHTKSLEFNELLSQVDSNNKEIVEKSQSKLHNAMLHNFMFSVYNKWRQSLDNIIIDEAFSSNQLAIEQPDAFDSGITSSVVQATKLVLLQEGDTWFTKELFKKIDCCRNNNDTNHEWLTNLLLDLNPKNLKISDSQKGKLLLLLSEIYTA